MSTTYTHVYSDALACLVCELSDDNIYFDKHKVRKEAIPSFGEKKKNVREGLSRQKVWKRVQVRFQIQTSCQNID